MSAVSREAKSSSFLTSGSLWGGLAGLLLGVGVAVGIQAGIVLFPLIVLGSSALGIAFGNAVGSILFGDKSYNSNPGYRNFSGGDLEQSRELIDHLRLREDEHKVQIEKETSEMARTGAKGRLNPTLQSTAGVSSHFQNMIKNQGIGQISR